MGGGVDIMDRKDKEGRGDREDSLKIVNWEAILKDNEDRQDREGKEDENLLKTSSFQRWNRD